MHKLLAGCLLFVFATFALQVGLPLGCESDAVFAGEVVSVAAFTVNFQDGYSFFLAEGTRSLFLQPRCNALSMVVMLAQKQSIAILLQANTATIAFLQQSIFNLPLFDPFDIFDCGC